MRGGGERTCSPLDPRVRGASAEHLRPKRKRRRAARERQSEKRGTRAEERNESLKSRDTPVRRVCVKAPNKVAFNGYLTLISPPDWTHFRCRGALFWTEKRTVRGERKKNPPHTALCIILFFFSFSLEFKPSSCFLRFNFSVSVELQT